MGSLPSPIAGLLVREFASCIGWQLTPIMTCAAPIAKNGQALFTSYKRSVKFRTMASVLDVDWDSGIVVLVPMRAILRMLDTRDRIARQAPR